MQSHQTDDSCLR